MTTATYQFKWYERWWNRFMHYQTWLVFTANTIYTFTGTVEPPKIEGETNRVMWRRW